MALVVSPLNYQLISTCESLTGWTGPTPALVADFKKEGTYCIGFTAKNSGNNDMYFTGSWDLTGKTIRMWFMTASLKEIADYASGGVAISVTGGGVTGYYYMLGGDTYEGGWINLCVDPSRTVDAGSQPTLSSVTAVGIRKINTISGKNQQDTWIDMVHCCDGLSAVDTATPYTLDSVYLADAALTGGWGVLRKINGVYFSTGRLHFDNLADSDKSLIFEERKINTSLYGIQDTANMQMGSLAGAAGVSGLTMKTALKTQTPKFYLNSSITTGNTFKLYGSNFSDFNTFTPPANASGREMLNCNFSDFTSIVFGDAVFKTCNFISYEAALSLGTAYLEECAFVSGAGLLTYQGGYLLSCSFIAAAVAVALSWNQNIDTSGKLDGSMFSSAGTGHAIELGTNTPSSITLKDITFTGYGSDGTTNAAIYNNSGKAITVYVDGGSTPTVRNGTGASTTIIANPVTVLLVAQEADGTKVASAMVFVRASNGTGPFPYEEAVTIVNSGTQATVTHTAHGMATNDKVLIEGASLAANNGVFTITVTGADTYTYTMASSPGSSPTGSITSTFVALFGTTDVNGEISMSRVFSTSQPVTGWARKSTGSPYYKPGLVAGSVSSSSGASLTALLVPDV